MHCISQTGELQTNSALNLIVFGTKLEHLDLIEYVVVDLLNAKYNTFVRRVFRRQMIVFLLFFCLSSFCFISRPNSTSRPKSSSTSRPWSRPTASRGVEHVGNAQRGRALCDRGAPRCITPTRNTHKAC